MAIFHQPKLVLFLKNKQLEVYDLENSISKRIEFPPNVFNHLQIVNQRLFNSDLIAFLSQFKPAKALLVLSDEASSVAKNVILVIVSCCTKLDWNMVSVVPEKIIEGNFSLENVKNILKNDQLLKNSNLLQALPVKTTQKPVYTPRKNFLFLKLALTLVIFIVIIGGAGYYFWSKSSRPKNSDPMMQILSPSPITEVPSQSPPQSSSSAQTYAVLKKEELKIQVLNRSGIGGQASTVADKLANLGYKDIETGNTTTGSISSTIIEFDSKVSDESKTEIVNLVKKSFAKITQKTLTKDSKYNVVITTGNP